ncbi:MAG: DinB family protein [Bacteroidota bacterium]
MKNHFKDLIRFNDWANQRMLITLEENEVSDDNVLTLFSHIISNQIVWLNRIKDLPTSPFPLWEKYKLRELRTMTMESSTNWSNYLEEHQFQTFEEMIFYKNSKEKRYESTIREIITHVLENSTYHRGQLALSMKKLNIEPPCTDYIQYARLR